MPRLLQVSTLWSPEVRKPRGNRDIRSTGAKVSAGAAIPRSHATPAERGKSAVAEHRQSDPPVATCPGVGRPKPTSQDCQGLLERRVGGLESWVPSHSGWRAERLSLV